MIRIVTNHWGWGLSGIWTWLRYGWAWPFVTWGVERRGSYPRTFDRQVKIGPVCFGWGTFPDDEPEDDPGKDPAVQAMLHEVIRTGRAMHMNRGEAPTFIDDGPMPDKSEGTG